MRARRALLYVPGDDPHKIQKAAALDVDSVCLDLEDGVAANRKQVARKTISEYLPTLDFGRSERLVRVNPVNSLDHLQDLDAVLPAHPDGFVLPKVAHSEHVLTTSQYISAAEEKHGWTRGRIILIAIIETAQAVVNLDSIASADPRLKALIFGAEDYAADIGATRSSAGWEIFYARSAVVTHAAAQRLQVIDMVNINFKDDLGLETQSEQGSRMGFSGKQIIHPNQIDIVQRVFTPSTAEIQAAVELMEQFTFHQEKGQGAYGVDGIMIDAPAARAAQSILERASAAGKMTADQLSRLEEVIHE